MVSKPLLNEQKGLAIHTKIVVASFGLLLVQSVCMKSKMKSGSRQD
jgi:hypothetical protein